eukprot:SAG31_NODE_176_length_21334_cov_12.211067_1_plen_295_part_00
MTWFVPQQISKPGQGHHYGTHLSPNQQWLSCHVTGGVSPAVRETSKSLSDPWWGSGYYAINAFQISDPRLGTVASRELVHSQEKSLFFDPQWSPDGHSVVYLDCQPEDDPQHARADLVVATVLENGTWEEPRWLTNEQRHWFGTSFGPPDARGGGSNTSSWAPNGRAVTYTRLTPGARMDARYDATRGNHEENVYAPELARGGTQICLIDTETKEVEELTTAVEGQWDFRPSFSPSGKLIVFTRVPSVGSPSELWIMDFDGSNQRLLTKGPIEGKGVDHARWLLHGLPGAIPKM